MGPPLRGEVVGAGPYAVYVRLPRFPGWQVPPVLGLLRGDAARLPVGCVLPAGQPVPRLSPGDPVTVGSGVVRCGPQEWRVSRWWDPAEVRRGAVRPDAASIAALAELHVPAIAVTGAGVASVSGMLGYGPGLTPGGDDAVVGLLLGMRAVLPTERQGEVDRMAADLTRAAVTRTTALSAALLDLAGRGIAARPVVDAVHALAAPPGTEVREAYAALVALGHTSGSDLAAGLLAAVGECR
ncbi:MAG: DUF2877 domain-containing protein [Streptosporangiales bacterium]